MSTLSHIGHWSSSRSRYKRPNSYYYVFIFDSATLAVRRVNKTHGEDLQYPFGQWNFCLLSRCAEQLQLCFVPISESAKGFQVDSITNRSDHQANTSRSIVSSRLSRSTGSRDPAMRNVFIHFVLPGTQRTDETPPVRGRKRCKLHPFGIDEGRNGRAYSVISGKKGWKLQ